MLETGLLSVVDLTDIQRSNYVLKLSLGTFVKAIHTRKMNALGRLALA